jgi:hypothetical protein
VASTRFLTRLHDRGDHHLPRTRYPSRRKLSVRHPASAPTSGKTNRSAPPGASAAGETPALNWEPRSDWVDVKKHGARGDGQADDTAAIQKVFDGVKAAASVYFPPGTYRVTRTVKLKGPLTGVLVVGHGRDTVLTWDGPEGGQLLLVDGLAMSRYVGLTFDGRGKAAVGLNHFSTLRFETEVVHRHLAFRNFTGAGFKAEKDDAYALAENTFENCLFEGCGHGTLSTSFNDYNWTYDGCEFRRCGTGIECHHGNFYARNCHFEDSRTVDVSARPEHGCSLRRCTSLRSNRFLDFDNSVSPLTVQDCHVAGWRGKDGAIRLHGAPVLLFDCRFAEPPDAQPPVRVLTPVQRLFLSNNAAPKGAELVAGKTDHLYPVPAGGRRGSVHSAAQSFLASEVRVPGKVFDARRDFGARGDLQGDDTAAVQRCIDAARQHGRGALAYLPRGQYLIKETLRITGADYFVGGSGPSTRLVWGGAKGGTTVAVHQPDRVTLEHMAIGNSEGVATEQGIDVLQTGGDGPTHMTYDGLFVFGMYQRQPLVKGLHLKGLGPREVVVLNAVEGNLRLIDAARATVLVRTSYEGAVTVEGKGPRREGFLGFMTRLSTNTTWGVTVRDNQNIVVSDLYVESADNGILLEGTPELPPGRATLTCSDFDLNLSLPKGKARPPGTGTALEVRDYAGEVFVGLCQFYQEPRETLLKVNAGDRTALHLFCCLFYGTTLAVRGAGAGAVHALGNQGVGHVTAEGVATYLDTRDAGAGEAVKALSRPLDDLRRLGDLDLSLNHPSAKR